MPILLIRLRQIGDVVLTTPAVHALRRHYPDAHIAYLVEPAAAAVVATNPHISDVIIAPRGAASRLGRLRAELNLMRRLRAERFDVVIDFHGGPRASLLAWTSGAPIRIGYDVPGRGWMYTRRVPRPRALRPRHAVENQWDLLEPLGIGPADRARFPLEMPVDPAAAAAAARRLDLAKGSAAGVTTEAGFAGLHVPTIRPLVVVHVSAGNPFRRWPLDRFAEVVAALVAADPTRVVLVTSGPSEHDAADQVVADARARLAARPDMSPPGLVVNGRDVSLPELRALVERAALYIGGDSGPLHVAGTSRVPIVAIYGPTLPARSAPWRDGAITEAVEVAGLPCRPCDQRVCEPGDFRCLTWTTPAQVLAAAERAIARAARE